ncbi:SOS response-associated peptidase family protein [Klebsiella pneumoniae subsp. ozaenae]
MTREEYLSLFANEADRNIAYDPEPIGRYNVAPGTRVLLLSERDEQLQLDPVHWGYAPGWWDKPPLINARVETAASSRMFKPLLMAAIGSTPFERGDEAEGFLIVTAAADKGLVDIHDRRPLVLVPDAAREWMKQDVSGKEAEEIAADGAVSADHFLWHPVTRAVGNVKNQGPELIEAVGL